MSSLLKKVATATLSVLLIAGNMTAAAPFFAAEKDSSSASSDKAVEINVSTGQPDKISEQYSNVIKAKESDLGTVSNDYDNNKNGTEESREAMKTLTDNGTVEIGIPSEDEESALKDGVEFNIKAAPSAKKLLAVMRAPSRGTLTYLGPNYYYAPGGYSSRVGSFLVNGQRAFCSMHWNNTPSSGATVTLSVPGGALQNNILRTLYYGWSGPGCTWGFPSDSYGIVETSLLLSEIYTGRGGGNPGNMSAFRNYIWNQPVPNFNASFSNSSVTGYITPAGEIRTQDISINGGNEAKVHMTIPSGMKLHVNGGSTYSAGQTVTMRRGTSFYFIKDGGESNGQTVSVSASRDWYRAIMWITGPSYWQNMSQLERFSAGMSLNVTWPKLASVELDKTNATGKVIPGASFKLTNKAGITYSQEAITDSNGVLKFTNIPDGTYTLTETKVPEDYFYVISDYTVTVKDHKATITGSDGKAVAVTNSDNKNTAKIINYDKGRIKLIKNTYQHSDQKILDAEFTLTGPDGYSQNGKTDANGKIEFTRLMPGTYTLKEISAPSGYYFLTKDQTEWKLVVTKDANQKFSYQFKNKNGGDISSIPAISYSDTKDSNAVTEKYRNTVKAIGATASGDTITVPNRTYHQFKIRKIDSNTGGPLAGAKFNLDSVDDGVTYSNAGKTDKDGMVTFDMLLDGTYRLRENYAPDGYSKDKVIYTVVVNGDSVTIYDKDGKTVNFKNGAIEIKNNQKAKLVITKLDKDDRKALEGAVFALQKKGTSYVKTATSSGTGKVEFASIEDGEYTLRETKAPDGHIRLTEPVPVTVKDGKVTVDTSKVTGSVEITGTGSTTGSKIATGFLKGKKIITMGYPSDSGGVTTNDLKTIGNKYGTVVLSIERQVDQVAPSKADQQKIVDAVTKYGEENVAVITGAPDASSATNDAELVIAGDILGTDPSDSTSKAANPMLGKAYGLGIVHATETGYESGTINADEIKWGMSVRDYHSNYYSGTMPDQVKASATVDLAVYNEKTTEPKNGFVLHKVDADTGADLTGAEWSIYKYDSVSAVPTSVSDIKKATPALTLKAGSDGTAKAENLSQGVYVILETKIPDNYLDTRDFEAYKENRTPFAYVVNSSGNGAMYGTGAFKNLVSGNASASDDTVQMSSTSGGFPVYDYANKKYPDIVLKKIDTETKGILPGAIFTLHKDDANGSTVAVATTGEDGKLTFKNVPPGEYYLVESTAPKGYVKSELKYPIRVLYDGTVKTGPGGESQI